MNFSKLIFAGTPPFAAHILRALLKAHYPVVGVYTQPDRPAGRGQKLLCSAVKSVAQAFNLPIFEPETLRKKEMVDQLAVLSPDLLVVVAYGLILPQTILKIPGFGCVNVHASLLPLWRGAAPIQRAILAGDKETGITIMQMDAGLDTGDVIHQVTCPILETDTAQTLQDRLTELGANALLQVLSDFKTALAQKKSQDSSLATHAPKITKQEARIDWQKSASVLEKMIRAYNPWPVAYTFLDDFSIRAHRAENTLKKTPKEEPGTILALYKSGIEVATGNGVLRILELQLAGKKAMNAEAVINGHPRLFQVGKVFR